MTTVKGRTFLMVEMPLITKMSRVINEGRRYYTFRSSEVYPPINPQIHLLGNEMGRLIRYTAIEALNQ